MAHVLSFQKDDRKGAVNLFKTSGKKDSAENLAPAPLQMVEERQTPYLIICRQCRQIITGMDHQITIQGTHQHTFANPHGILFVIGCFKKAEGCAFSSFSSGEFTWFRGFNWSIANCSACMSHLGWHFTASHNISFFGLILDKLIFPEQ